MPQRRDLPDLPTLTGAHPLGAGEVARFQAQGFVVLRQVLSGEEVSAYRAAIRDASAAHNDERRPLEARDAYGAAFLQTQNLRLLHPGVARLVRSRRLGRLAAELMGVDAVRVFHDQSLFKEPGPTPNPTPWHQDQYYWPFAEPTTAGLWLPLVDVTEEMGLLKYAPGTHRRGDLGDQAISDDSQAYYDALLAAEGLAPVSTGPMAAGDACFHWGWTLHAAGANISGVLREAMVISYFADGMRVAIPRNAAQEGDRLRFLGGRAPGARADHPLNPVVYRR